MKPTTWFHHQCTCGKLSENNRRDDTPFEVEMLLKEGHLDIRDLLDVRQ